MKFLNIFLYCTLTLLTSCTSFCNDSIYKPAEDNHAILSINDEAFYFPKNCFIFKLDYDNPDFARLSCSLDNDDAIIVSLLNLRFRDIDKERFILAALKNTEKAENYTCGTLKYPLFSCYSEELGLVINSENQDLIKNLIQYQKIQRKNEK